MTKVRDVRASNGMHANTQSDAKLANFSRQFAHEFSSLSAPMNYVRPRERREFSIETSRTLVFEFLIEFLFFFFTNLSLKFELKYHFERNMNVRDLFPQIIERPLGTGVDGY